MFVVLGLLALLAGCGEENRFVAPPPPKVTVELPVQQTVTPYLEATGNAAAVNTTKLVARVQGYLQEIKYAGRRAVKKGTPLFVIEPEPYQVKLEQAQAAEDATKATLVYAEAEFKRYSELRAKDVSSEANLDKARANRDTGARQRGRREQPTRVTPKSLTATPPSSAPFDGVVTARKVSVGELVGGDQPNELATIVQLEPIWVWFNLSERDVQRARASMACARHHQADLPQQGRRSRPVCRPRADIRSRGMLDYADPSVNQSTGTMQLRGVFENADHVLLPGYFVRVRVPLWAQSALLVPEVAIGADQGGRYVLALNADNVVAATPCGARPKRRSVACRHERPEAGRAGGRRRHPRRHPGAEGGSAAAHGHRRRGGRLEIAARHDLEILHRAARSWPTCWPCS